MKYPNKVTFFQLQKGINDSWRQFFLFLQFVALIIGVILAII